MTPCVLIATNLRVDVTCKTIEQLLKQSLVPEIVLVTSKPSEMRIFKKKFPSVKAIIYNNEPLGAKWQFGVDYACQFPISSLGILGSDDFLSVDYIRKAHEKLSKVRFFALQRWWIYEPESGNLYYFHYTPDNFPLGGGRFYRIDLLKDINYSIFNTKRNRCLDDYGWEQAQAGGNYEIITDTKAENMDILAVKGDWKVMNPLKITLRHKNAKLLEKYSGQEAKEIIKQKFGYETP